MKTESIDQTTQTQLLSDWEKLFTMLREDICDDYRCTDDPDDDTPGMCVTIGFTPESDDASYSWGYQTGDNSFTGGAYCHPHWAVVYLYRDTDPSEAASDALRQILELLSY